MCGVRRGEGLGGHRPAPRRARREGHAAARGVAVKAIAIAPIRAYQRFVSPLIPRRCKYHPTCSAYAVDAVREFGVMRGFVLAGWRLLRCNPWSHGGVDYAHDQTVFRR
ncbi:MAG: membrane protein insertion efficiency factor YidD [Thermoleophilia bacterium]|nr:membrane protein insertion efficiency factor YidD [Thermoleophilia bacterium]